MRVQRFDKMLITDSMLRKDSSGFLTVYAPITRPGVFPYQRTDGTIQFEAKLPDDVFNDLAIESAKGKAVTDQHPKEPVTIHNINRYAKGMTHTDSRVQNSMLYVSMTITDAALIEKVYSGEQSEISIGFTSDIVEQRGTYKGEEYGFVQQNIEINHVAIVDKGRAGPQVAIRSDSDAWQVDSAEPTNQTKGGKASMAVYKIDKKEYEVDEAIKLHIENLELKADKANKDLDALKGTFDSQKLKLDAAENDLKELKEKTISADELEKKVEERVALIETAKPLLGDSFDFKGKSDIQIKEAVIQQKKADFKADGLSNEYVNAFYEGMLSITKQDGFSSTGDDTLLTGDSNEPSKVQELKNKRLNMNK